MGSSKKSCSKGILESCGLPGAKIIFAMEYQDKGPSLYKFSSYLVVIKIMDIRLKICHIYNKNADFESIFPQSGASEHRSEWTSILGDNFILILPNLYAQSFVTTGGQELLVGLSVLIRGSKLLPNCPLPGNTQASAKKIKKFLTRAIIISLFAFTVGAKSRLEILQQHEFFVSKNLSKI